MRLPLVTAALFLSAPWLGHAALDEASRKLSRDILSQLIAINTTDTPKGSVTDAAVAMRKRLLDAGFPEQDLVLAGPNDRKQNLVIRFHGTSTDRKPILIICHLDVVEAKPEDWTTNPFELVEKDGYFYGRGTLDVKSGDAILVANLIRFKQEGFRPDRDITIALTADEEGGTSNGVKWLIENRPELMNAAFVLNPDSGGVTLESGRVVDVDIEATEKLYADFELTVRNPGGHSSMPTPDNAIYHLADSLTRLQDYKFPVELNTVTRAYFEAMSKIEHGDTAEAMRGVAQDPPNAQAIEVLAREPRYNSMLRTTCVATRLNAGHANNALPQTAQAIVNCRILPGHSPEEVRQTLLHVFNDPKVQVDYIESQTDKRLPVAPTKTSFAPPPLNTELMKALNNVVDSMWPGVPIIPEMETGASDSVYTMAAGIPSYGVSGVGVDTGDMRAHGKDERIRVSAYYEGVEFYYKLLRDLTSTQ